jgi:hypothetical protein
MALRFSSGLLTGLQQYGQGGGAVPADPRQRNAMQAAGVTNPLLQQFGMGLGGLLGTEMRSPAAVQQAQLTEKIGAIKDPSSYEGMVQMAKAIMPFDPIQGAQLLAKAEEMRKAQMEQLDRGQEEIASRLNQTRREKSLAEAIQEDNPELARLIRQGDQDAYKRGVALLSPPKDKSLRFDVTEKVIDGKLKKVQIGTDPITGKVVSQNVIGDVIDDDGKDHKNFLETAAGSKAYNTVNEAKREADLTSTKLDNYIAATEKAVTERTGMVGGLAGLVRETVVSQVFGAGDELTVLTANLNQLRMEGALKLLPKGPASDRDVQLALDASVDPKNLKGEELLSYLRGLKAANEAAKEYYAAKEQWIVQTEDANALGFEQWADLKEANNTIEAIKSKNPAQYEFILGELQKASLETDPDKRAQMIEGTKLAQQMFMSDGELTDDIIGLILLRGEALNTFENIKKQKNIASFRGL